MDHRRERSDPRQPARLVDGRGDGLDRRLERWAAEARVDEAARARARERWLRRQAEEDATVAGVLADMLDAATPVTVHTRGGHTHAGVVRAVGVDFLALGPVDRRAGQVVLPLAAVGSVRSRAGAPVVVGDRPAVGSTRLQDVLAGLGVDGTHVRVMTVDGETLSGVVRSVGRDVVVLATGHEPAATAYVPSGAISAVALGGE